MKNLPVKLGLYVVLLGLVAVSLYLPTRHTEAAGGPPQAMMSGDESAAALHLPQGVPVVLEFSSPDCPTCTKMRPVVEKMKQLYAGNVEFVDVNVTDQAAMPLIDKFNPDTLPSFFLLDAGGNVVNRFEGEVPEMMLKQIIGALVKK